MMIDNEKSRKKQSLKVIISEAVMVLAVVVMVAVLALVVSGYWLGSDFKVERQGMLQVASVPTGADLAVDGESSWLQRTNTSKVVAAGGHNVTLTKEGYDTWSKDVNVSEGLLYRLHYPRLFLLERKAENVLDAANYSQATISPDGSKLLLMGDTTEWQLVNLDNDTLEPKKIGLANYLPGVSLAEGAAKGIFAGKVVDADWDQNNSHVVLKIEIEGRIEWVLVDVENVKNSLNLSKEFGVDFDIVEILDNSANNLLTLQNGNLRKIDVPSKAISAVLAEKVTDFDHYENEIVYVAKLGDSYGVSSLKIGDDKPKRLEYVAEPVKVVIYKFYDDMYIATLRQDVLSVYKKVDFELVNEFNLNFVPQKMKVGHNGEFVMTSKDKQMAALDMEANTVREWAVDGDNYDWLDNDMLYSVAGGELMVYDYDGLNRRMLAQNVSSHFPVTITDNKWLYYFSDGDLVREKIVE